MKETVRHLYYFFLHLGPIGLLAMGILDSSFLFCPLGNDLLVLGLVANHPKQLVLDVLMAALGSVIGCAILDVIARKGGEEGLEKLISKKQIGYVKRKVEKKAGWALALAALMPPPFPFSAFVAALSAFKYPRKKLLGIIFGARCVRFAIIGGLAAWFGKRILSWAESPFVHYFILFIVGVSVIGSVASIWKWIQRARAGRGGREPVPA